MDVRTRRIYEARREGLLARLADEGVPRETGLRLFAAWEDEAYARGLTRQGPGFWAEAPSWIRAEAGRRWSGASRLHSRC